MSGECGHEQCRVCSWLLGLWTMWCFCCIRVFLRSVNVIVDVSQSGGNLP